MSRHITKYKQGAVSIYIVVFLTLIFGVITLSFIRIILNDAIESTNTDLYQSAYDSALAGIEDAKIALIKYHDCLSQGIVGKSGAASGTCQDIIYQMEQGANNDDCDVVQKVLGRSQEDQHEVIVQETQNSTDAGNSYELSQAYTCVKITESTDDYLTTLTSSDDVRIIPLRSADINNVNAFEFSWYTNNVNDIANKYMNANVLEKNSQTYAPPVITLEIFQTDSQGGEPYFTLGELSANNDGSSGTDHALLVLKPVQSGGVENNLITASNVLDHSDKYDNAPINVNCDNNSDFACKVTVELPPTFRGTPPAQATRFLRVNIPYEQPNTDVSVTLCTEISGGNCTNRTKFTGVQAAVDSTGRANDLYRRVESRIELVDVYYPFPEYTLYLSGKDNELNKSFYVTENCKKADNGAVSGCANSANI